MTITYVQYVNGNQIGAYEKLGWICKPSLRGTHHADYAEWICEWRGENPPEPEKERP